MHSSKIFEVRYNFAKLYRESRKSNISVLFWHIPERSKVNSRKSFVEKPGIIFGIFDPFWVIFDWFGHLIYPKMLKMSKIRLSTFDFQLSTFAKYQKFRPNAWAYSISPLFTILTLAGPFFIIHFAFYT